MLLSAFLFAALAPVGPAAAGEAALNYDVAEGVEVTDIEYFLDEKCKIADQPCLTFTMTLKNVSSEPKRFITRLTLSDEKKSVGGFVPRKGNPPVIEAGKEVTVTYPMFHYEMPKTIDVEVTIFE
jgi:hypothetical protein